MSWIYMNGNSQKWLAFLKAVVYIWIGLMWEEVLLFQKISASQDGRYSAELEVVSLGVSYPVFTLLGKMCLWDSIFFPFFFIFVVY
jgi:hypothetical protein